MTNLKNLPKFENEEQEREFWESNDATDYIDFSAAQEALFPNLKPTTRTISVRLPEALIDKLKTLANKRDVPYQSLLKLLLAEKVEEELHPIK